MSVSQISGQWDLAHFFFCWLPKSTFANDDGFVKSLRIRFSVIPAEAGIQFFQIVTNLLDSSFQVNFFRRLRFFMAPTKSLAGFLISPLVRKIPKAGFLNVFHLWWSRKNSSLRWKPEPRVFISIWKYWIPAPALDPDPGQARRKGVFSDFLRNHHLWIAGGISASIYNPMIYFVFLP